MRSTIRLSGKVACFARYRLQLGNVQKNNPQADHHLNRFGLDRLVEKYPGGDFCIANQFIKSKISLEIPNGSTELRLSFRFSVREPFPSKTTGATFSVWDDHDREASPITLPRCLKRDYLCDGIEADYLSF